MLRVQIKQDGKWITHAEFSPVDGMAALKVYNEAPMPKRMKAQGKVIAVNSEIRIVK
jgi:hypothetical protein